MNNLLKLLIYIYFNQSQVHAVLLTVLYNELLIIIFFTNKLNFENIETKTRKYKIFWNMKKNLSF